jgi:hypothetical protein
MVYASVPIWLTNVIVFGLWYWELDRGGPALRQQAHHRRPDFLFPQMSTPGSAPGSPPGFLDYPYTSFTNATAFSPTDTMSLTAWAKLLMMLQSLASLVTVGVLVSRAVNILNCVRGTHEGAPDGGELTHGVRTPMNLAMSEKHDDRCPGVSTKFSRPKRDIRRCPLAQHPSDRRRSGCFYLDRL